MFLNRRHGFLGHCLGGFGELARLFGGFVGGFLFGVGGSIVAGLFGHLLGLFGSSLGGGLRSFGGFFGLGGGGIFGGAFGFGGGGFQILCGVF